VSLLPLSLVWLIGPFHASSLNASLRHLPVRETRAAGSPTTLPRALHRPSAHSFPEAQTSREVYQACSAPVNHPSARLSLHHRPPPQAYTALCGYCAYTAAPPLSYSPPSSPLWTPTSARPLPAHPTAPTRPYVLPPVSRRRESRASPAFQRSKSLAPTGRFAPPCAPPRNDFPHFQQKSWSMRAPCSSVLHVFHTCGHPC
jgi:hypothetical protein